MDNLLECNICTKLYSSKDCVPRMLPCGHTICTDCLRQILGSSKSCPDCRQTISKTSSLDFPVNYCILKAAESVVICKGALHSNISKLHDDYSKAEIKLQTLKLNAEKNLDLVNRSKRTLDDFINNWEDKNGHDIKQTLDLFKIQLSGIYKSISDAATHDVAIHAINSISLKSEDFSSSEHFLSEIYKQILQGEKYVAVLKVGNEAKYASLSVWEKRLKIHCFQPMCTEPGTKTICFHDFKKCLEETKKLIVFFDVNLFGTLRHHIFVDLCDTHFKSAFTKMCSGENGKTFRETQVRGFLDGRKSRSLYWICNDIKTVFAPSQQIHPRYSASKCSSLNDVQEDGDGGQIGGISAKVLFQFNLDKGMRDIHEYCCDADSASHGQECDISSSTYLVLMGGKFSFVKRKSRIGQLNAFIIGKVICEETETCHPGSKCLTDSITDCGLSAYIEK